MYFPIYIDKAFKWAMIVSLFHFQLRQLRQKQLISNSNVKYCNQLVDQIILILAL